MFQAFNQDLPDVEGLILVRLGPRDLISAKQVCQDWAEAVRRFTIRFQGLKKCYFRDALSGESFDPITIFTTVKTSMRVRGLTINKSKEVYILGGSRIIQGGPSGPGTLPTYN